MIIIPPIENHLGALHTLAVHRWDSGEQETALRLWQQGRRITLWMQNKEKWYGSGPRFPLAEVLVMLGIEEEAYKLIEESSWEHQRNEYISQIIAAKRRLQGILSTTSEPTNWTSDVGICYSIYGQDRAPKMVQAGTLATAGCWYEALAVMDGTPNGLADIRYWAELAMIALAQGERIRSEALLARALAGTEEIPPKYRSDLLAYVAVAWNRYSSEQAYRIFQQAVECLNEITVSYGGNAVMEVACALMQVGYSAEAGKLHAQLPQAQRNGSEIARLREASLKYRIYRARYFGDEKDIENLHVALLRADVFMSRESVTTAVNVLMEKGDSIVPREILMLARNHHYDAVATVVCGAKDPQSLIATLWQAQDTWAANVVAQRLSFGDKEKAVYHIRKLPPTLEISYTLARLEQFNDALAMLKRIIPRQFHASHEEIEEARSVIQVQAAA